MKKFPDNEKIRVKSCGKCARRPWEKHAVAVGKFTRWPHRNFEKIFSKSFRKIIYKNKFGESFEKFVRGGRIGNGRGRGET